jgi:RNA polymerase sigma-70 factor (ECF subfamily)
MLESVGDDGELAAGVVARDPSALDRLYRLHGRACLTLARRVAPSRQLAEEIVQDVFLRFWNAPDRYDPSRGSVRSFLMTSVHSRAIDVVRSERSRRTREERDGRRETRSCDVVAQAMAATDSTALRRALLELGEHERNAIVLAYFGGHSYREVARILGQPEGTVKSRIRAGLARLHAALEPQLAAA